MEVGGGYLRREFQHYEADYCGATVPMYEEHEASEASAKYPYLIFRPAVEKDDYILLLALHGVGARSNQPEGQSANISDRMVHALSYRYTITGILANMDKSDDESHLDEEYRKVGRFLREHFVVVAPQSEACSRNPQADGHLQNRWGQPGRLQKFLRHVISEDLADLKISSRVVLGISMGGAGAWNAAFTGEFKAAISVSGEGYDDLPFPTVSGQLVEGTRNDQALNFPILQTALWAFHSKNDRSDNPSTGTEPVLREARNILQAFRHETGQEFLRDHLRYNWCSGKEDTWTYFDGVWDNDHKSLLVTQEDDDIGKLIGSSCQDVEEHIMSSVELTSSGPPHDLWGHFLWTVVMRDITVFEWLRSKASEDPILNAQPLDVPCENENACGLLPNTCPVQTKVHLSHDGYTCHMMASAGIETASMSDQAVLSRGSRGVVVSGQPGLPTLYEVAFAVGKNGDMVTLTDVPGTVLEVFRTTLLSDP